MRVRIIRKSRFREYLYKGQGLNFLMDASLVIDMIYGRGFGIPPD